MNILDFARAHWARLGAGGLTGGGLVALFFRDSISRFWAELQADRKADRDAKTRERERPDHYLELLLKLTQDNLSASRAENRAEITATREQIKELTLVLNKLSGAVELLAQVAGNTYQMVKETRDNTIEIKGAVN